jgi:hypothetical protein
MIPIPYNELTIAGYSPVPEAAARPKLLTMIFRHGESLLFAPYRLLPDGLLGGAADVPETLGLRCEEGTAAALKVPIPAKAGHLLWIDSENQVRYEPKEHVLDQLSRVSQECLSEGEGALCRGDAQRALSLANQALRIDGENIYALVLAAAAYTVLGKTSYANRLAQPAQVLAKGFPFDHHVANLLAKSAADSAQETTEISFSVPGASGKTSISIELPQFRVKAFDARGVVIPLQISTEKHKARG